MILKDHVTLKAEVTVAENSAVITGINETVLKYITIENSYLSCNI